MPGQWPGPETRSLPVPGRGWHKLAQLHSLELCRVLEKAWLLWQGRDSWLSPGITFQLGPCPQSPSEDELGDSSMRDLGWGSRDPASDTGRGTVPCTQTAVPGTGGFVWALGIAPVCQPAAPASGGGCSPAPGTPPGSGHWALSRDTNRSACVLLALSLPDSGTTCASQQLWAWLGAACGGAG